MKILATGKYLFLVILAIACLIMSCKPKQNEEKPVSVNANLAKPKTAAGFTIRFRPQWIHQAQYAGVYMAAKKGYFSNYGLNVEIQTGGPENPAFDSINSGKTDITQLFLLTALSRDSEQNNLVNLAQISQKSSLMLVGKKARGINSVKDLNNKKIGLWRTDFRELSLIFLQKNNLIMNVINIDSSINLFLNDALDVMNVMRYNEYHSLIQAGINPDELFVIPFSENGLNIIEDGIYTTKDFYRDHTKECQYFTEAVIDGWLYAINHQEETVDVVLDIMRRHHIRANRAHQAWMLSEMRDVLLAHSEGIGHLQESDFNTAKNLLKQQGLPFTKQTYREFYPYER
ncbi:MAG: ABC transporter substrate-binding protein [Candidatus Cloacimonas sp.]|nr:ABC transporter substrate-binding protein [Candidatus Cloacimonas sp.]